MATPVRSVSQGFAILRLLGGGRPLTLSEVGRATGLSPSSALNLLRTLVAEGAVEREAAGKRYRLTAAWSGVEALRGDAGQALTERALPAMERFARASGAAVGLWKVASRDRMHLVAHVESNADVRLRLADAQRQPLGGGAAGRAVAAAQGVDAAELARRFAAVRWQAELGFADYAEQVRQAARQGFAIDRDFAHRGIWTVAVAIPGVAPGYCLSASIFAGSRSEAALDGLGRELCALRDALLLGE
ncbi:MAG: IclR family transcriptional regulator [Sphingopyxis sp.]|nr:IclR family transcriptional regulator [Sphingopyxis sp.]